jgi:hypothetical protein
MQLHHHNRSMLGVVVWVVLELLGHVSVLICLKYPKFSMNTNLFILLTFFYLFCIIAANAASQNFNFGG